MKPPLLRKLRKTRQSSNLNFSVQTCWLRYLKSRIKRFLPDELRATDKGLTTRGTDGTSTIAELATSSRKALVTKLRWAKADLLFEKHLASGVETNGMR